MKFRVCLLIGFLFTGLLHAQTSGAGGGAGSTGGGSGSGSTGGGAGSVTGVNRNPSGNAPQVMSTMPVFISGKVAIDDGSPVPPNIAIKRTCNTDSRTVSYTNAKGAFSFQWGQRNGLLADADVASPGGGPGMRSRPDQDSDMGGMMNMGSRGMGGATSMDRIGNCELRAELPGYRSSVINLFNHSSMDSPEVGVIILHRIANVEGVAVSATSFAAPKDAKKAFDKGLQDAMHGKNDDAAKAFEKAVAAYPKYAEAWAKLGQLRMQMKSYDSARDALKQAIEADPKLVAPYVDLGLMAANDKDWKGAAELLDRALKLDPIDYPMGFYAAAAAHYNLKELDVAEKDAREAIRLDAKHSNPRADYLLAMVLVDKEDYEGAAAELRSFVKMSPDDPDIGHIKEQLASLENFLKR